jgi:hypothetical protein
MAEKVIPPTSSWQEFTTGFGFSFMHDTSLEVSVKKSSLTVGDIVVKVEKLNCKNGIPNRDFVDPVTTIYGYKTIIDEENKSAYICNNSKTACLNIYSKNEDKTTEGYFHAFMSTLKINDGFDKIPCS